MNSDQVFKYSIAGTGLDVERITKLLTNYGIHNINIRKGHNVNELSLTLKNPTKEQLEGIRNILLPLEQDISNNISRVFKTLAEEYREPSNYTRNGTHKSVQSSENRSISLKNIPYGIPSNQMNRSIPYKTNEVQYGGKYMNNVPYNEERNEVIKSPRNIKFTVPPL